MMDRADRAKEIAALLRLTGHRDPDVPTLGLAVDATSELSLEQIRAACRRIAQSGLPRGRTVVAAIVDAADSATRKAQTDRNASREPMCLPPLPGPLTDEQVRGLYRHARPASSASWSDWELVAIAEEIDCAVPSAVQFRVAGTVRKGWIRSNLTADAAGPEELIARITRRNQAALSRQEAAR